MNVTGFTGVMMAIVWVWLAILPAEAQNADTLTTNLVITSNIKHAAIYINGDSTGKHTPTIFKNLPEGKYTIELVEKYGKKLEKVIQIYAGQDNEVQLDFYVGQFTIDSNLPLDSIVVNGNRVEAVVPVTFDHMPAGDYSVQVYESYGNSLSQKFFLSPGDSLFLPLNFSLGDLEVKSNLKHAAVWLNGKLTGQTVPALLTDLAEGIYDVMVVSADGKYKIGQTIKLKQGSNTLNLAFEQKNKWRYYLYGAVAAGVGGTVYLLTRKEQAPEKEGIPNPPDFPR